MRRAVTARCRRCAPSLEDIHEQDPATSDACTPAAVDSVQASRPRGRAATQARVTTTALEVLVAAHPNARISSLALEAVHSVQEAPPPPPSGRRRTVVIVMT